MRDLFQVVFELKKKEIELARQHIQSKSIPDHQPVTLHIKSALDVSHSTYSKTMDHSESNVTSKYTHKEVHINLISFSLYCSVYCAYLAYDCVSISF